MMPVSVNRTKSARRGFGCSGLVGLLLAFVAAAVIFVWPGYIDRHGSVASGVIVDKYENMRIRYGEWYRRLEVVVSYSIAGQSFEHRAVCDVDEKTYDALHLGNRLAVHYFAALLQQPFIPATHLEPCSAAASLGSDSPVLHRFIVTFSIALVILFLWRVLRIRMALWLFLGWIGFAFFYMGLPRLEPEPRHPVAGTATVNIVSTITTLGDMPLRKTLPLQHPYQIVLIKFVPPGNDVAVTAIDKVDAGSVPNLKPGQSVNILYDPEHPRIARLQQGTRFFPEHTLGTVVLFSAIYVFLVAMGVVLKRLFSFGRAKRSP